MAAFWLTAAIATLFALPQYDRYHTDLAQDPTVGADGALMLVLFAFSAVIASGLSIPLALLDAGGRPAARILTWILGGVAACIALLLLLLDPFDAISWHHRLMTGTSLISLTLAATVTVLIAHRSSSEYFRKVHAARQAARFARTAQYKPVPAYAQTPAGWAVDNPPSAQPRHPPQPEAHATSGEEASLGSNPGSGATTDIPIRGFEIPVPGAEPGAVARTVLGLKLKDWAVIGVALLVVVIGVAVAAAKTNDEFSSTASDSETDPREGKSTAEEPLGAVAEAQVGDCFVSYGNEYSTDIEPAYCGTGTFEAVDIVEGSSDLNSCDYVEDVDKIVTSSDASRVLCLSYIAIDGDNAYHAKVGECVYGPNAAGVAWNVIGCETGAFRVLERLEGETDRGMCTQSTYYNHSFRYPTDESYLDVVLCLQMIYPHGDIAYAEQYNCMYLTQDGYDYYFKFAPDCDSADVYVTARTNEYDADGSWCRDQGWVTWSSNEFPDHSYTICWANL